MNENELETCSNRSPLGEEDKLSPAKTASKPISPAKLAANRRNGQKSKGPNTEEGKSRSRWNAVKHGVLSRRLLVLNDDDRQTYALLLENLARDLNPGNALEQILVEKIAMCYWRLHIAYGFEADFARSRGEFIVVAERMGRYANTIHRQLLSAMNELERLQRRRVGEAVPAPIAVEVTVDGINEEWTDERPGPHGAMPSIGPVSIPGSERLIGSGACEGASETSLPLSEDEVAQFCETNPPARKVEPAGPIVSG